MKILRAYKTLAHQRTVILSECEGSLGEADCSQPPFNSVHITSWNEVTGDALRAGILRLRPQDDGVLLWKRDHSSHARATTVSRGVIPFGQDHEFFRSLVP